MSRVRIDIDSLALGDITITREDPVQLPSEAAERAHLAELLARAVTQTCRAYDIEPVSVSSRVEEYARRGPADPLWADG